MSDGKARRKRELFDAAIDLPVEERAGFLDRECPDPEVRRAVERLLRLDQSSDGDYLSSPVARPAASPKDAPLPEVIGRYRITGHIGEGGMGVVYEGAQESPQRAVAIKVVRKEMISSRMLSRLRNEAEILGRLDHPGIARIYEAGTAQTNGSAEQPFFAMELVRGTPLLEYARDRDTNERLQLFADICDAVHHAHQKGVIHRDLKPANILVTRDGQVKVLDFGIARVTDADIQAVTVQTDIGQLLGTVPYMSPEQVMGNVTQLDTRSDVYALGVVLFELLTGALPHDVRERSVVDAARIIHDDEATRLSTVAPDLRGDLEWITAKAMEKDVDRRYDSASAFAADVRRHLAEEPVLAGPPSASYRLRKFIRRNKVGVGWAAAAALLLVVGVAATAVQSLRATHAEQASRTALESWRREAQRGQVAQDFLIRTLTTATPEDADSIRRTIDAAAEQIERDFGDDPRAEADLRRMVGTVYTKIGAFDPAYEQLVRADELLAREREIDSFVVQSVISVRSLLNLCERERGRGEAAAARWYLGLLDALEPAIERADPALADAVRAMRADLVAPECPPRSVQDERLARVMSAWERTPDRERVGMPLAIYVCYMYTYVNYTFDEPNVAYGRAQVEIQDELEPMFAREVILAVGLYHATRTRSAPGDEERRVADARRMAEGLRGWWGYWVAHEVESILGDALVQRGRAEDAPEIAERLTAGARGLRGMEAREGADPWLLEARRGRALRRMAGVRHDASVIHLLDQPEILEELRRGIDALELPEVLEAIAASMSSRRGRSERWYAIGAAAAERAAVLPPPPASAIYAARGS